MAKVIKNPIEVVLHFDEVESVWQVSGWSKYKMTASEYPDLIGMDKMLSLSFTEPQQASIIGFASSVIYPQISAAEGI